MKRLILPLFLLACTDKNDTGTVPVTGPEWSLFADQVGDGMLLSAWSDGPTMYAVGGGMGGTGPGVRLTIEGETICTETLVEDQALWWIHGNTSGDYYMVGDHGTILHSVDGTITREDVDTEATLYGVWVEEDGQVFAVGGDIATDTGEIWTRIDGTWSLFAGELEGVAFKVWQSWVVGDNMAWYLEGETAEEMVARPPGERLLTVRGASNDDVWAVGGDASAVVLHWVNGEWESVETAGLSLPLMGVWTDIDDDVWVSGMSGTQGFWNDHAFSWQIPDFPLSAEHFHAVWPHEDQIFFLGGNMMATEGWYGSILRYGETQGLAEVSACE
jgi:hypothetical protein